MSEQSAKKGAMVKDTIIYMIAKCTEAVVGVLTMSVMTYLFVADQMGKYSTINIAITTIGLVATQWLAQAVLRYINKYEVQGRKEEFLNTVFSAWLKANGIIVTVSILFILAVRFFFKDVGILRQFPIQDYMGVLLVGVLWFVTYNTYQLVTAMVAALRQSVFNLVLSVISVVGKLGLIVLFCKLFGSRIEWIFLSYFIVDGAVSLIGIIKLRLYKYFSLKQNSGEILRELRDYGTPLMGNMLTTSVLNKSDIYIVTAFLGASAAGIYQTNYSLVATAFTMLATAIMRGSYPTVLRVWSEGKKDLCNKLISEAARMYLLLAVPAVVGVGILSDVVAKVLYAPEYFSGNGIMVWVALGMMMLGLTEYTIKPWELNAKTKSIFSRSLIGGGINVGLNLILVPIYGYKTAAVTTFIGFLVYFILARFGTRKYVQWHLPVIVFVRIIGSAMGMAAVLYCMKKVLPFNLITLVFMVAVGVLFYGVILFLSGEIREEVKAMISLTKNRKGN